MTIEENKPSMKYFPMDNLFNNEMLERFINFFNNNQSEPCTILLHTRGGSSYITDIFVLMIGQMTDCTIIISAAYSSGFELALKAKCKKVLLPTARGMHHLGKAEIYIGTDNKPYYQEDLNHTKNFPIEKKRSDLIAKKVMTKEEYSKFKTKNEEIWFDFKRMKQIFPDAKVLN